MIQLVCGKKGSGKTKKLVELAHDAGLECKGNIAFVDKDSNRMFHLDKAIRFIDASKYPLGGKAAFLGFVCGIMARDFDMEIFFIDGFLKIIGEKLEDLEDFFSQLDEVSRRMGVRMVITISAEPSEIPPYMDKYEKIMVG